MLGQGDELDPRPDDPRGARRRPRRPRVGGRRGVPLACSTACSAGSARRASRRGSTRRSPALSGGERRRIALAQLLLDGPELLLLDEPTNHLDVEGVDWLARHLAARRGSLVVVTHDRWFLDAVVHARPGRSPTATVHQYEGGYAAYVLARAERDRQAAARDDAPPAAAAQGARVAAPRAARADVQAEVPHRGGQRADRRRARAARHRRAAALRHRAAGRQGARRGRGVGWRSATSCCSTARPGGSGRATASPSSASTARARRRSSTCWRASSRRAPAAVERGATVRLAHLSQDTAEIPGHLRVLESLEEVRGARHGQRRARDHRRAAVRALRLPRRQGAARWCATCPAASAAGCSSCGC